MDAVTGDLISKLVGAMSTLAQEEVKTIRTAKVELDHLIAKLKRIKSVVERAESLPFFEQKEIKSWILELKGIIYDAEDMIEVYLYKRELLKAKGASSITSHTLRRKRVRMAFTYPIVRFKKHLSYPYKLGHNIKNFDQQLSRFIHNLECDHTLQLKLYPPNHFAADNSPAIAKRATISRLVEGEEVGREGDKEKLKKQLLQGEGDVVKKRSYSIVAIVGKGGLGKTFLAQMVFNDEQVKEHFADHSVWWVCVSEKPNSDDLMKKLLEAIFKKDASDGAKDSETLCSKLQDSIKDKKFLLVLDDVWNLNWWEKLEASLQEGAPGSKILVTSRKKNLMERLKHNRSVYVHDLQEFTGKESRRLFTKQIGKTEAVLRNEGKLEIGERILNKCGGLPLVIKTIGSLLRTKETRAQWENVEKSPIWSWKEDDDDEGGLLPGLILSYDDLQPHLKNCFVYCCLFPKDFIMERNMLTQQWTAHGLVEEKEEIDIEQSANDYLNELVSRCLLEDQHVDLNDGYLRMHDVIHDLALHIGKEEYSNDLVGKNTRHLSMTNKCEPTFPQDGNSKLRTLLCPQGLPSSLPAKAIGDLKGLRVLQLRSLWDEFPHLIGKLLHLRYLELRNSHVQSIGVHHNLPFLRTLKLYQCQNIKWLPCLSKVEVMKLKWLNSLKGWSSRKDCKAIILPCLMTLEVYQCPKIKLLPNLPKVEVIKLKQLDSFEGWSSREDSEAVILPCLKTLEMYECPKIKWLPCLPKVNVMNLELLNSLERWSWSSREDDKAIIFPSLNTLEIGRCNNILWLPCIPKLEVMKLKSLNSLERLSSEDDGKVVILPSLKTLEIHWCPNIKWLPCFPKVEVMKLESLDSLEGWQSIEDSKTVIFPCLRILEMYECQNIQWLPSFPKVEVMKLKSLTNLERLSSREDSKVVILSSLRSLEMYWCRNIKWLPCLSKVEVMKLKWLNSLEGWSSREDGKTVMLPSLSTLEIKWCRKIKWFPCLPKVEVMKLKRLDSLEGLSSRENSKAIILPSLRTLDIKWCSYIKWLPYLPKVEVIKLKWLNSLEGWSSGEDGKVIILPSLRTLETEWCCNIKWLPCLPKVEVMKLKWLNSLEGWSSRDDGKVVILSSLRILDIEWCYNIKWLPYLPKVEVMKLKYLHCSQGWSSGKDGKAVILPSLMMLEMIDCLNIKVLPNLPAVVQLIVAHSLTDSSCLWTIPPSFGSLDLWFYIQDHIEVGHTGCRFTCLKGSNQGNELFVLELFSDSQSMSRDHAIDQIGKKHEDVLEGLQPPHHLQSIRLKNYLGKQLPSWFSMEVNVGGRLKELNLYHCLMFKVLPRLPVVEHIRLEGLRSLEEWWVGDDEGEATFPRLKSLKMDDCPSIKLLPFLPVVEEVTLMRLPKCEGWPKWDDNAEMPYLKQAYVRDCPHLSCFPSSFNVVLQMSFDGDCKIGLGTSSSIMGVADESSSSLLPSSSVDNLELWFKNACEEQRTNYFL